MVNIKHQFKFFSSDGNLLREFETFTTDFITK